MRLSNYFNCVIKYFFRNIIYGSKVWIPPWSTLQVALAHGVEDHGGVEAGVPALGATPGFGELDDPFGHQALVELAMLAEHIAMVGREYHNSVIRLSQTVHPGQQTPNLRIELRNKAVIQRDPSLDLVIRQPGWLVLA